MLYDNLGKGFPVALDCDRQGRVCGVSFCRQLNVGINTGGQAIHHGQY